MSDLQVAARAFEARYGKVADLAFDRARGKVVVLNWRHKTEPPPGEAEIDAMIAERKAAEEADPPVVEPTIGELVEILKAKGTISDEDLKIRRAAVTPSRS